MPVYVCEVCDRTEELTEEQAFRAGWDYPPFVGEWGIVSPRICGQCTVDKTAYGAYITGQPLTEKQVATVARILAEVPDDQG